MNSKRRFVQVGLGGRAEMYYTAIAEKYADRCEIVGLCDRNEGRLRFRQRWLRDRGIEVGAYLDNEFDRMLAECRPDTVIVTTQDSFHDEYICRSMEAGYDVITEKPMTIDEVRCRRIVDTQARTGRKCTVTFNYRYSPPRTQVR